MNDPKISGLAPKNPSVCRQNAQYDVGEFAPEQNCVSVALQTSQPMATKYTEQGGLRAPMVLSPSAASLPPPKLEPLVPEQEVQTKVDDRVAFVGLVLFLAGCGALAGLLVASAFGVLPGVLAGCGGMFLGMLIVDAFK